MKERFPKLPLIIMACACEVLYGCRGLVIYCVLHLLSSNMYMLQVKSCCYTVPCVQSLSDASILLTLGLERTLALGYQAARALASLWSGKTGPEGSTVHEADDKAYHVVNLLALVLCVHVPPTNNAITIKM